MFELFAICLMTITPQDLSEGVTEMSLTTRQEFITLSSCENKADKMEMDKTQDCQAFCHKLKRQK